MPTYEYECNSCGNSFEVVQKMSEAPVELCPECGKTVHRVLSGGIGISFRGAGFYVTDSGSSGGAAGSKDKANAAKTSPACPACSAK